MTLRSLNFWIIAILALAGCGSVPGLSGTAPAPPAEKWPFKELAVEKPMKPVMVLMYHDVVERRSRETVWYDVTTKELKDQIEMLEEEGASFITLDQLYQHLSDGAEIPDRAVCLTFDDSYQGFFDNAYPYLKEKNIPSAMFVHTDYIGSAKGRPKMDLDTLKVLVADGLVTIGSHTMSHPEHIELLTFDQQKKELGESRALLEKELGIEVRYLSWPVGNRDALSISIAKDLGYRMAVTMDSGSAHLSDSIMEVRRWNPVKIKEAWKLIDEKTEAAPSWVEAELVDAPVESQEVKYGLANLALVTGGLPESVIIDGRESVGDIVTQFEGVAGINGGFFAIADIASTDNRMIGPNLTRNVGTFYPDLETERVGKLIGRPVVLMANNRMIIAPFRAGQFNDAGRLQEILPGVTDVFMAGCWLVHKGKAQTREQMEGWCVQDAMDYRRRAFIGWTTDKKFIVGACLGSFRSDQFAQALEMAGIEEAVMMDSGFSTSVIFDGKVLASGHSTKAKPSRPVPHAIVIKGNLAGTAPANEESPSN